jgi:hypothetical protein
MWNKSEMNADFENAIMPIASFADIMGDIAGNESCSPAAVGLVLEVLLENARRTFQGKLWSKPGETSA